MYEGQYHLGERHGEGKLSRADGGVYIGQYRHGLVEGHGRYVAQNGDVYEGAYHEGHRKGRGKYTFADGRDVYDGEWVQGQMHGHGQRVFKDSTLYEGEWRHGKQHGRGLEIFPSGSVYEGEFEDGVKHGRGRRRMVDAIKHMIAQGTTTEELRTFLTDADVRAGLFALMSTGTLVHEGDWVNNMETTPFKLDEEFFETLHYSLGLNGEEDE